MQTKEIDRLDGHLLFFPPPLAHTSIATGASKIHRPQGTTHKRTLKTFFFCALCFSRMRVAPLAPIVLTPSSDLDLLEPWPSFLLSAIARTTSSLQAMTSIPRSRRSTGASRTTRSTTLLAKWIPSSAPLPLSLRFEIFIFALRCFSSLTGHVSVPSASLFTIVALRPHHSPPAETLVANVSTFQMEALEENSAQSLINAASQCVKVRLMLLKSSLRLLLVSSQFLDHG